MTTASTFASARFCVASPQPLSAWFASLRRERARRNAAATRCEFEGLRLADSGINRGALFVSPAQATSRT